MITQRRVSRRMFLGGSVAVAGLVSNALALSASPRGVRASANASVPPAATATPQSVIPAPGSPRPFMDGDVNPQVNGFDPSKMVTAFNPGQTSKSGAGQRLREYNLKATNKTITVAPGQTFDALALNNRVPGPTLRATEGDRLRINYTNNSNIAHILHFNGVHPQNSKNGTDVTLQPVAANGGQITYEFDAPPFGVYLYQSYAAPLALHAFKGLYGMLVIDPKNGRPVDPKIDPKQGDPAELFMVLNAFAFPKDNSSSSAPSANNSPGSSAASAPPSANNNPSSSAPSAASSTVPATITADSINLIPNVNFDINRIRPGQGGRPNRRGQGGSSARSKPTPTPTPQPTSQPSNGKNPAPQPASGQNPAPQLPASSQAADIPDSNDLFAINTVAYHYVKHPIPVKQGQLVRVHLANVTEFDQLNSFHLHGTLFNIYRSGTSLQPNTTDSTIMLGPRQTAILEFSFPAPGQFLFHAFQGEFADQGLMGIFTVQ